MVTAFFPQYSKAGVAEILTSYSIKNKTYNVYLITVNDEIKFVHDEREKGKLEYITIDNAAKSIENIDRQINKLTNKINELKKIREQNSYIIDALQKHYMGDIFQNSSAKKPFQQSNAQNKRNDSKEQPREKFIINTPLGFVSKVEKENVDFTENILEAKTFENAEEAIKLGEIVFKNQLPFRVGALKIIGKEYNHHKCHCSNEGDFIVGLLNQIFSGVHPNEVNMEKLKEFFPDAEIKGFVIDEKGNIQEL